MEGLARHIYGGTQIYPPFQSSFNYICSVIPPQPDQRSSPIANRRCQFAEGARASERRLKRPLCVSIAGVITGQPTDLTSP